MPLPHEQITSIPNNEPDAVPSLWNERYAEINTNFQNLDERLSAQEAELQASRLGKESLSAAVSAIVEQMGGITGTIDQLASPIHMQKAMRLDLKYREKCMEIEMFVRGYNLSEAVDIPVLHGVKGDDSIDVENTADLEIGHHYLLQAGDEVRLIQIYRILSKSRMRFYGNLSQNLDGTARITSMTFTQRAGNMGGALASVGARWVSKRVHLGDDERMRLAVIRCRKNEGDLKLSFIDEHHDTWQPCAWTYKRDSRFDARIPEGFVDIEYTVPMRGMGQLSLEVVGEDAEIAHMVFLGNVRSLGIGVRNPALPPALASEDADLPPAVAHALAQIERAANQAQATATQAQNIANQALEQAQSAENTANQASEQAQSAQNTANQASEQAQSAENTANQASEQAQSAENTTSQNNQATSEHAAPVLSVQNFENKIVFVNQTVEAIPTRTVWQVKREGASWDEGLLIDEMSSEKKFRYEFQKDALSLLNGMDAFVIRSRFLYGGKYTAWSNELSASIDQLETADGIIGVCIKKERIGFQSNYFSSFFDELRKSPFQRIDSKLNVIKLQNANQYFKSHPIYKNIVEQVIDGDHMIKIPKFYVKRSDFGFNSNGSEKLLLQEYFLISPAPQEGFELHPAFYHDGEEKDCFWVGKYMASATTHNKSSLTYDMPHKLRSLPAMRPLLLQSPDEGQEFAQYERGSIANLYGIWNIHQLEAIKLLMLIEGAHANYVATYVDGEPRVDGDSLDVQWDKTMKGQDTPSMPNVDDEKIAADSWRGIVGLWSSLGQWVYGCEVEYILNKQHNNQVLTPYSADNRKKMLSVMNPKAKINSDGAFVKCIINNASSYTSQLMLFESFLFKTSEINEYNKAVKNTSYLEPNQKSLDPILFFGNHLNPLGFAYDLKTNKPLEQYQRDVFKFFSSYKFNIHWERNYQDTLKKYISSTNIVTPITKSLTLFSASNPNSSLYYLKAKDISLRYPFNHSSYDSKFAYLHGAGSSIKMPYDVGSSRIVLKVSDQAFLKPGMWSFWLMPLETKAVYAAENHDKPYAAHGAPTRIMKY